jgi:NTE family protein
MRSLVLLFVLLALGGCASRPVNPPIAEADPNTGYRFQVRHAQHAKGKGKPGHSRLLGRWHARRGVFLRSPRVSSPYREWSGPQGQHCSPARSVDVITGVSGGSFTALAYGLYGDKLFAEYEQRFLKRDVQGEIIARTLSPGNWGTSGSLGWGRSELAAELYDEILFNGATFGDLDRGRGPLILASATDISTGARFVFNQNTFDVICSDLNAVPLSRAAAASSAVPVVLSPVTINNYGGTCNTRLPPG